MSSHRKKWFVYEIIWFASILPYLPITVAIICQYYLIRYLQSRKVCKKKKELFFVLKLLKEVSDSLWWRDPDFVLTLSRTSSFTTFSKIGRKHYFRKQKVRAWMIFDYLCTSTKEKYIHIYFFAYKVNENSSSGSYICWLKSSQNCTFCAAIWGILTYRKVCK